MKKNLLSSFAVLVLALGSPVGMYADNVVYGLSSTWDNTTYTNVIKTASFDMSSVNASSETTVNTEYSFSNIEEVKCAAAVGNKYYAFVKMTDEDFNEIDALVSINFTTGKFTVINDFSYKYGKPGYDASAMTYDKSTDKTYVTEVGFDENDNYITTLYILDQATGELSKVTSWLAQYQAIASDNNGGLYLLQNITGDDRITHPNLYKATGAAFDNVATVVENGAATGYAQTNSLVASEDGKTVYLVAGKNIVEYDVDAKTSTVKGALSTIVAGATYGKSTEDGTPAEKPDEPNKNTRMLVELDTYGSPMGDIDDDVVSGRDYYYYNVDGKPVGFASFNRGYGEESNTFTVTDITKYVFDENGNVTNENPYQWGWYDFDEYAWKKTKNCVSYTYNENGKVETKIEGQKVFKYTYNEDGTLKASYEYAGASTTPEQTITYSNYDENGNALSYVSDGKYDDDKYQAELGYDENGNKVDEFRYTVAGDDPEFPEYKGIQHETWTYNDNILAKYERSKFDAQSTEYPTFKREFTPVEGNTNVIDIREYDFAPEYAGENIVKVDEATGEAAGAWNEAGRPKREYYTDFSDMAEATATEIIASQPDENEINTADLAFSVPQLAMTSMYDCKVVIYRDCMPIDTVSIFDIYSDQDGCCIYQDKGLKNGTYTYFVQPLFAPVSGELDADGGEAQYTGYYSSNPVDVTLNTELPKVKDLKLVGGEIKKEGTFVNMRTTYYGDLAWENPTDTEKYGFIKNSVYFVDAGVPEVDITDANENKARVMLYDADAKAYVVTSYKYGKAVSDTIDVKLKDIEALATGIGAVTVNDAVKATFDGNTVTLGENANVAVFATSGQKVYEQQNTNRVDLGSLSAGTYVVTVEKNGKVNAYKYNVK